MQYPVQIEIITIRLVQHHQTGRVAACSFRVGSALIASSFGVPGVHQRFISGATRGALMAQYDSGIDQILQHGYCSARNNPAWLQAKFSPLYQEVARLAAARRGPEAAE
ncbi:MULTISPECIES: hypothetical protein [Rhodomicrobium]|uniref:hypothetical protein n=1 Tax=Rhodomicrobium TaxID=1068 RepID=UPI000F7426DF|nr:MULTISPECIES: hypothetical protein [Rhodomicrobium]